MEDLEQLFSFPDLELVTNETKAFSIREAFLLPVFPPTAILKKRDYNFLISVISDNDGLSLRRLTKILYTPNGYGVIAHHLALFAMT